MLNVFLSNIGIIILFVLLLPSSSFASSRRGAATTDANGGCGESNDGSQIASPMVNPNTFVYCCVITMGTPNSIATPLRNLDVEMTVSILCINGLKRSWMSHISNVVVDGCSLPTPLRIIFPLLIVVAALLYSRSEHFDDVEGTNPQ
jgi:hypothetical protein